MEARLHVSELKSCLSVFLSICLSVYNSLQTKKITSEGINQDLCAHFLEVPEFFTKVQEELENVLEKVNY